MLTGLIPTPAVPTTLSIRVRVVVLVGLAANWLYLLAAFPG